MTAPDPAGDQDTGTPGAPEDGRTFTQNELNSILAKSKREIEGKFEGFDDLKSKAEQFDALTKTAEESRDEAMRRAEAAETELAWANVVNLRNQLAAGKGLDAKLWSRVQGETKEEIEADISDLMGSMPRRTPGINFQSGASGGKQLSEKERAVEALRGLRQR
jgi:hypothetical protein